MNTAMIKDGVVENVIVIDDDKKENYKQHLNSLGYVCVDSDTARIGDSWDGTNFTSPPETEVVIHEPPKHITKLAFRNRFTPEEKVTIEMFSLDDPNASLQQRQVSATLRYYLKDLDAATYIDLDRSDTQAGVQNLETAGLLAAGRANEILTAPILLTERYIN